MPNRPALRPWRAPLVLLLGIGACARDDRSRPAPGPGPADTGATASPTASADSGGAPPLPTDDPCAADVPDPGAPLVPDVVGTLTVTVRTGSGTHDGTNDATLALCLAADRCFPLADPTGEQLDAGAVGVWSFEDVGLPRSAVDRVELRVGVGTDHWRPSRIDLRFDGEPVHCADLAVRIGTDPGDLPSWSDPAGLRLACAGVWPSPLTHGPMVGAVSDRSARLWVRADATRSVSVRVWPSDDPGAARIAAWAYPRAEDDFAAVLDVGCLAPETRYTYELSVDGAPTFPGAFVTAPPADVPGELRLAFGSCARDPDQPIFADILASRPDVFAFVGDNHYANSADLDVLRWYYRWSLERFERAAMVREIPVLATWDDHDFVGNNTWGDAPGRAEAQRAFREYWANPATDLPASEGIYFSQRRGDVDLIFLDDRSWRGVQGSLLGDAQHDWLVERLTTSTATFKLVIDGSQWSFTGAADSWDEFRAERDEIFRAVADADVSGVALLSGDIHRSELRALDAPGYPLPEITSSPLANPSTSTCAELGGELLACADGGQHWVEVVADTRPDDPTLTATIRGAGGRALASHTWRLSALGR